MQFVELGAHKADDVLVSIQKAGCNAYDDRFGRVVFEFQSSSGQKAGCNPPGPSPLGSTAVSILIWPEGRMQYDNPPPHAPVKAVSILIRPEGRMQPLPSGVTALGWHLFQSSSGQKTGCNRHHGPGHHRAERVSILIRPSGRMQPWRATMLATIHSLFQSSSGLLAGCNGNGRPRPGEAPRCFNPHPARRPDATCVWRALAQSKPCFNPHPAFWPDATMVAPDVPQRLRVSILIRPEGRMQHSLVAGRRCAFHRVSILIRPEGRMQHQFGYLRAAHHLRVSILIRPSGRMQPAGWCWTNPASSSFNPHPAFWPDATPTDSGQAMAGKGFNPHPAFWPDATAAPPPKTTRLRFQSSSGLLAGCNREFRASGKPTCCFNPHPAFWPDATPLEANDAAGMAPVSILIRPSGRMQQVSAIPARTEECIVSILIRPEGRMQPACAFFVMTSVSMFQSSSGQKAGCNACI